MNRSTIATAVIAFCLSLGGLAPNAHAGNFSRLGFGVSSPLLIDMHTYGASWDKTGGYYWGLDFPGPHLIIGLTTDEDFGMTGKFTGGGYSVHLIRSRGGGFWGVSDWLAVGFGMRFEWGGVVRQDGFRAEGHYGIGAEIPLVVTSFKDLYIALVTSIDWMLSGNDRYDGMRVGVEASVNWRAVGPLVLYGSVGFQHISGGGFDGVGTAPTWTAGLGLDFVWFFQ